MVYLKPHSVNNQTRNAMRRICHHCLRPRTRDLDPTLRQERLLAWYPEQKNIFDVNLPEWERKDAGRAEVSWKKINKLRRSWLASLNTARKVKCDLGQPVCGNCIKAQQACRGYGIQLSWPRRGDDRRALVYDTDTLGRASRRRRRKGDAVFLNTFYWDVLLWEIIEQRKNIGKYPITDFWTHFPGG